MTPRELLNDAGIFLKDYGNGRHGSTCPRCSAARKTRHQKLKCLYVTVDGERAYWGCNHCQWTGPERGAAAGNGAARPEWPHYDYGEDLRKVRRPKGGFFWQHRNGKDWESGTAGADTSDLLYRIDEVHDAIESGEVVLVVEGEKDAETCWKLGFAATCNAHGASQPDKQPKWTLYHSEQLRGADLVVAGDNDEPGRAHVAAICQCSLGIAASVRLIDLAEEWPDLPPGGDISDWAAAAGAKAEQYLEQLVAESRHYDAAAQGPAAEDEAAQAPQPQPAQTKSGPTTALPLANLALDGLDVPQPEWSVHNRIPLRQVCLLSGHGAVGKSTIALQLACGHTLGRDWLGAVAALGGALYIDCEDDFAAIHYRLEAVRKFYGASYQDLIDGGLEILPMAGLECVMAVASTKSGTVTPTALYWQVLQRAADLKYIQVIIANASNVFAGNEVDRSQVQQFIGLLKRITNVTGGSVTLISHSSLAGLATETGLSGSTQWHNAVRARMWMHAAKTNGADQQPEGDVRALDFMKNQYGKTDDSVVLRWRDGLFLPEPKLSDYETAARAAKAEQVFVAVLRRCIAAGRNLSDKISAHNYAPRAIAIEDEAKEAKVNAAELAEAMRQLFKSNRIKVAQYGKPSSGWGRIEEVE